MVKQRVNVTIDSKLKEEVDKYVDNFSEFVEMTCKKFIDNMDTDPRIMDKLKKIEDNQKKLAIEKALLHQQLSVVKDEKQLEKERINETWMMLRFKRGHVKWEEEEENARILGIDDNEYNVIFHNLEPILAEIKHLPDFDEWANDWEIALKNIRESRWYDLCSK